MQTYSLEDKKKFAKQRGYTLLMDENFNARISVPLRHDETGVEYLAFWSSFREGRTPRTTTLNQKIKEAKERGYTLLAEKNPRTNDKVSLRNDKTGNVYNVMWKDFLDGDRERAFSSISIGEAVILAYLKANLIKGYSFTFQHKIDLPEGKHGYFDFSISKGDRVLAYIEYNGIQHYAVVEIFGEDSFTLTQESDRLKSEYADKHDTPLLVIPYTVKDIAQTLRNAFPSFFYKKERDYKVERIAKAHTSLEEKRELAKSKGYTLDPAIQENFTHMDKVTLLNSNNEPWRTKWQDFIDGAKPRKEEHQRRIKGSLEEKQKIAEALGYRLLETENFTVKKKVRLVIDGEEQVRMWEPILKRFKALNSAGIDL